LLGFLADDFTVHVVNPQRGLPIGATIRDVADDAAAAIAASFAAPVTVGGISPGGSSRNRWPSTIVTLWADCCCCRPRVDCPTKDD
jgi:hypothetical protein